MRLIAFYLPQFHPIPENDVWWGKGFTEWTNVAKATPLFAGHYQPRLPADLGFYDLRIPENRQAQADMAQTYGITGFCYWHYWFAGKRLLERPFCEVLQSGEPDFPFCLAWANQSWTGIWHNAPNRILIKQTYPGQQDHKNHFYALLDAFCDKRYLTVDEKPVFIIYSPEDLPNPQQFTDYWRNLAVKSGLPGLYFIAIAMSPWQPEQFGFDATILNNPAITFAKLYHHPPGQSIINKLLQSITGKHLGHLKQALNQRLFAKPIIYAYKDSVVYAVPDLVSTFTQYPCVVPNWDNTPRCGIRGIVWHQSTPALFKLQLQTAIQQVLPRVADKQLIFIKSWNEWAEGNYLEPDQRFGKGYLTVIKELLNVIDKV